MMSDDVCLCVCVRVCGYVKQLPNDVFDMENG